MLFSQKPKFNRWDVVELETPLLSNKTSCIGIVTSVNHGMVRFVLKDADTATYDGDNLLLDKIGVYIRHAKVTPTGKSLEDLFLKGIDFFKENSDSEGWEFAKELTSLDSKDLHEVFGEYHVPGILNKYSYGQAKKVYDDYVENHKLPEFKFGDKVYAEINGTYHEGIIVGKFEEFGCYSVAFEHLNLPQTINAKYLIPEEEYIKTANTMTL